METKTEVRTFKIDCLCDECKTGYMRPTGIVLTSYPMKFPHKCTNCNKEVNYSQTYPLTRNEEIVLNNHIPEIVIGKLNKGSYEMSPQGLFNSQ